ncbi:hypothetical protein LTR36_005331 [Oleoguttula mirabilis]|uniref:Deacetylase sirtuin-type domain-containing protein n=1 Tax=Oleoguttula mirabilis TaxID=1507867 RepID=A0AAV9JF64_9PEZI|nr:hypothetical protein LTR36_005331 [Oleoguttula mirabilis]
MPRLNRARPEQAYPSPTASQQTSQTCSPAPDGMDASTDRDGPPPAKRRRISRDPKERTTEYLDLRSGVVEPEQQEDLDRVLNILHKRQKIVVIAGAGMSVSAGIPDFRSETGLFKTLKDDYKLKGKGQDLFDASVYKDDISTQLFHSMVSSMSRMTKAAKPTAFHHMLATMAREGRLLRLYSQNVDGLETSMEPLQTHVPLSKDAEGKWPRTVQLHGGLDKMVCTKCHELSEFDADIFDEATATPPMCPRCEEVNDIRTNHEGKRSHGVGWLRPRMVLYNEHNPDQDAIGSIMKEDLRRRPDAVIVVGTSMKIPGVKRIVKELCGIVRDRKDGGLALWINPELPQTADCPRDCFDILVQSSCDDVANHAAMRKWDDPVEQDDFSEVSEEDVERAAANKAEVHLPKTPSKPKCPLTHANLAKLASGGHVNNSFRPPPPDSTPKKAHDAGPADWSPLSSRRTSVFPSIECAAPEGDNITVAGGLLTPTKSRKSTSRKSTPAKKMATINEKLKDAAKPKKPAAKKGKSAAASKPAKRSNVKYVKPALPKSKASAKTKTQAGPKSSSISNAFTQTKAASVIAKNATKKALPSPAKSPSKLRQVSNAEPSSNTSPSKSSAFSVGQGVKRKSVSS